MAKPDKFNVIITSNTRSAVSEIFGFVKDAYKHQFKKPLEITYEVHHYLDAISAKKPLLKGWHAINDADPKLLLERGYDKVVHVTRNFIELCRALVLYHRNVNTLRKCIRLMIREPDFFVNIQKRYDKLNVNLDDPRFFRLSLEDWNNHLTIVFDDLLDFLEFPKEGRLRLVPVKTKKRNFESFSCSHLPKEQKMCERVEELRKEVKQHG